MLTFDPTNQAKTPAGRAVDGRGLSDEEALEASEQVTGEDVTRQTGNRELISQRLLARLPSGEHGKALTIIR
ncbi:hypothetical protein D3C80_2102230 [compost metagenome]